MKPNASKAGKEARCGEMQEVRGGAGHCAHERLHHVAGNAREAMAVEEKTRKGICPQERMAAKRQLCRVGRW